MADWTPTIETIGDGKRRVGAGDVIRNMDRYRRTTIGKRIRYLEPPALVEFYRREARKGGWEIRRENHGDMGTIIAWPAPGLIGSGPQIRWDKGHISWLGSMSRYEIIS